MPRSLFTNRNSRGDFVREALVGSALPDESVFIASAFFTEHQILRTVAALSGRVRLVVRLGFPTSPNALQDALDDPFVDVRYFTAGSFHPKLYIYGDRVAYVGSANLTGAASISNQEILVAIPSDDPRFEDLAGLFGEYWDQAAVLTGEVVTQYREVYAKHKSIEQDIAKLDENIESLVGQSVFANISRDVDRKSKENLFVDSYRRTYQESVRAFGAIRDAYLAYGTRKVSEASLPLRLEIDSFFSFVRDHIATGEAWRSTPVGWTAPRQQDLKFALDQWHSTKWPHLESTIVGTNYPRLIKAFASEKSIRDSTDDQLFDALLTLHSFHDSLRFHSGGLAGLKKAFLGSNDPAKVRKSLAYLVHGKGELVQRMANLIYSAEFKLDVFGKANVQELVGWHNKEDLPVVNGRTTKMLRYFGFDVRQL